MIQVSKNTHTSLCTSQFTDSYGFYKIFPVRYGQISSLLIPDEVKIANSRQKKPHLSVGEDRDGVYGKEKQGSYSVLLVLLVFWAEGVCKPDNCCCICSMRCSCFWFSTFFCSGVSRLNIWLRMRAISTWRSTCS